MKAERLEHFEERTGLECKKFFEESSKIKLRASEICIVVELVKKSSLICIWLFFTLNYASICIGKIEKQNWSSKNNKLNSYYTEN
jgi:hypothetical protein